jgi:hypothetical protein
LVKSQSCKTQQQMAPTDTGHCSPNVCTATWLQHAADILAVHCTEMLLQVTWHAVQRRSGSPEHALMTCPQPLTKNTMATVSLKSLLKGSCRLFKQCGRPAASVLTHLMPPGCHTHPGC